MRYSYRLCSTTLRTVLVQDSRAGGKATDSTPVKSTWPDQSHSSSTRGYHRTSYLKWRTRRISPSLISTRRNFCIDVLVSVYADATPPSLGKLHWRAPEPTSVEQRGTRAPLARNRVHTGKSVLQFQGWFFRVENVIAQRFKQRCFEGFTYRSLHRVYRINAAKSKYMYAQGI